MRERQDWIWNGFVAATAKPSALLRGSSLAALVVGASLLAASGSSGGGPCAPLAARWSADVGEHTYRLRGRYSIASLSGDGSASAASDGAGPAASAEETDLCVPPGLYRVSLEPGYTLERSPVAPGAGEDPGGDSDAAEVVPALLVSPEPLLVSARAGRAATLRLAVVDVSTSTAEPEALCLSDS